MPEILSIDNLSREQLLDTIADLAPLVVVMILSEEAPERVLRECWDDMEPQTRAILASVSESAPRIIREVLAEMAEEATS